MPVRRVAGQQKKGPFLTVLLKAARHKTILYRRHNDKRLQYPDLFFYGACKSPEQEPPHLKWSLTDNDLLELLSGVFSINPITHQDGSALSFKEYLDFAERAFGVSYDHPYDRRSRLLERKKSRTPLFDRIILEFGKSLNNR